MDTKPKWSAVDGLKAIPEAGRHEDFVAACEALGFRVRDEPSRALVLCGSVTVAEIAGDTFALDLAAIDTVGRLPDVTPQRAVAFSRCLAKLERQKNAVHEAGHAIAACELGLKFRRVRLEDIGEVELAEDPSRLDYSDTKKVEATEQFYAAGAALPVPNPLHKRSTFLDSRK